MILPCSVQTNLQGEELREHGTHLFPVACYYDIMPGDEIPWHWHKELEFGLVVEGTAIVDAGSMKFRLKAGEAFLLTVIFCMPPQRWTGSPVNYILWYVIHVLSAAVRIILYGRSI